MQYLYIQPNNDPDDGIIHIIIRTGGKSDGGYSSIFLDPFVSKRSVQYFGYGLFQLYNASRAYYQ